MPTSTSEERPLLLVLGMGYSAARFVSLHRDMFRHVIGTARNANKAAMLEDVKGVAFDGTATPELLAAAREASHVLVSIPPDEVGDPAFAALGDVLGGSSRLRWIGYLSTTGVYGDRAGAWTDENAPLQPQSVRARRRVDAETAWRSLAATECAVQIFRLSGIYGPSRNALVDLKAGTARCLTKSGQVFNRIHVDDIAQVIAAAMARPEAGPVFNVGDDEPAPSHDVVTYAARLLGVDPPPTVSIEDADLSELAKSFWAENKRIANKKLSSELGVDLLFPTYREGLLALFAAGEGRS